MQGALAACGWEDAGLLEQQDTSEAFSFITDRLQLPLLSLKMDIYHTGKEDPGDDHKIINERLLEVAIPEENANTSRPIQLEDCLESYFNNRVEVVRHLERTHTLNSKRSTSAMSVLQAKDEPQIEVNEVLPSPDPGLAQDDGPTSPRPASGRARAPTLIRRTMVQDGVVKDVSEVQPSGKEGGAVRKEVLMPAWQFFNLIRSSIFFFTVRLMLTTLKHGIPKRPLRCKMMRKSRHISQRPDRYSASV